MTDPVKIFEQGYIEVLGYSEEGQSRFSALRVATVIAQRNLLEQFKGITVSGETMVKNYMMVNDKIKTQVNRFLKGAVICGEKYYSDRGYAEVCLHLNIRGKGSAYEVIMPIFQSEGIIWSKLTQDVMKSEKDFSNTVVQDFWPKNTTQADGLIIELSGKKFKPALANRIITKKGETIFGPSIIISSILAERGCGGFTNRLDKAKELLASWGSKQPVIIKATNVHKSTDAVISTHDAFLVFESNQKTSFLAQAKVVFVIQ
ncbi:conserved hypothetical protein [Candidatus Magnetomoraceae bacterium gMMP-15]